MSITSIMEGCVVMMEACRKIEDATAGAVAELLAQLRDKDVEIEEQRIDNIAMKEWGVRVEARRVACAKKDEAARLSLMQLLTATRDESSQLEARTLALEEELLHAEREMVRLREAALETCSVSRTVMLQNAHTRMEREMELMREAACRKAAVGMGIGTCATSVPAPTPSPARK